MPVTLAMRWLSLFLLVFFFFGSCRSGNEPFDRHGYLILTKHARCRMDCRHITMKEIREILDEGTINYAKSEPDAHPDPKYALEGFTDEKQHLRIIIAPEGAKLIVITCIELGVEWQCDCN
jgi:Domain of unknown function (DUF4258)